MLCVPDQEHGYAASSNDIYSFAMLCYFIISGKHPFIDDLDKLKNPDIQMYSLIVTEKKRPNLRAASEQNEAVKLQMDNASRQMLMEMIETCWHSEYNNRLPASVIVATLTKILHKLQPK